VASKGSEKVVPAPTIEDPALIRNVVLVGHSGAGKTTLAEALLAATGTVPRAGSVADGTTVTDFEPTEHRQQRSVALAVAPVMHAGTKINLLDSPGYADFVGELRAGLRAADSALFVVSAVDGVDAATVSLWEECAAVGMPRAVAITRLDHPRADFDETVATCRREFGDGVLPAYLPALADDGSVAGLVSLLAQEVSDYSAGGFVPQRRPADPEHETLIADARNELIEGIITESEDETLLERYSEGDTDIDVATLVSDLEKAVERGSFYPVIGVVSATGVGMQEVLDLMVKGFPSPLEHPLPAVTTPSGDPVAPLTCDPQGPPVGEVVRTAVDPYVGRVSLVRMFSGTLRPDTPIHISGHGLTERGHEDHDVDERLSALFSPLGATMRPVAAAVAGDICAITKIGSAETGDTVSSKDNPLLVAPWDMPEPLLPVAVRAASRSDEDAMSTGLAKLTAGDPTLRLERNQETNQLVLWCMGEAHADVVLDKLRSQGVELETEPVIVPFRETFASAASAQGRHIKQSGGHGQYAVCMIEVEPTPTGTGFEFVDKVFGGSVPRQFIPSVEKGVRAQMDKGVLAGFPLVDLRVTLVDGKAHSVDSSDAAFQTAGALALREAAQNAKLVLLEPVDQVDVTVPDAYVGAVMGDLSTRRGRVLGSESMEHERTVVRAEIPETELLRYAIELRAMTAGTGTFSRTYVRHDPMPDNLAATVVKERSS